MKNAILLLTVILSTSAFAASKSQRMARAIKENHSQVTKVEISRDWFQDGLVGVLYPYTYWDGFTNYTAEITSKTKFTKCKIRANFDRLEINIHFCEGDRSLNSTLAIDAY